MSIFKSSYFFAKAIENIRRNLFINLVTSGVITLSFLIFGAFIMLFGNINSALEMWENDVQIEAYLSPEADKAKAGTIMKSILQMAEAESATYVDKDEAMKRFKKSMGGMSSIAEGLEENPLPASIEIRLKKGHSKIESIENIVRELKKNVLIEDIAYGQEWTEKFATALAAIRLIGFIIGVFLLMATIFIVSNTIKLTVYAKKEELEIAKLLGATNFFVKTPFFIEGLIQGLAGSLLSIGLLYLIYIGFLAGISSSLGTSLATGGFRIEFLPIHSVFTLVAGGMLLGFFGSLVSVGRFLKE